MLRLPDGRALRYVEAGRTAPVVVFEAGLGGCASAWVTVQRIVAEVTQTVSYDRAGHAGSTPATEPRSLDQFCRDLHALIQHVSPGTPVVLVAHSFGGPIIRHYSALHPDRVAGLVLVDATTRQSLSPRSAKAVAGFSPITLLLHRLGVGKALMKRQLPLRPHDELPEADVQVLSRDLYSLRSARAAASEAKALPSSVPILERLEASGLPPVPVITLVATGTGKLERRIRTRNMVEAYRREMARHPHGDCRILEGGHLVPQEHPRRTADAILEVVAAARRA